MIHRVYTKYYLGLCYCVSSKLLSSTKRSSSLPPRINSVWGIHRCYKSESLPVLGLYVVRYSGGSAQFLFLGVWLPGISISQSPTNPAVQSWSSSASAIIADLVDLIVYFNFKVNLKILVNNYSFCSTFTQFYLSSPPITRKLNSGAFKYIWPYKYWGACVLDLLYITGSNSLFSGDKNVCFAIRNRYYSICEYILTNIVPSTHPGGGWASSSLWVDGVYSLDTYNIADVIVKWCAQLYT